MKLLKEQVMWDYYSKFDPILDKYVPARGEGETIASQIVTAVNKLVYKWYNDGDVYDNTKYLKGWANDLSSYANWLYKHLGSVLKGTLSRIFVDKTEDDYEETLKELADKTLDETFLSKFEKQPKLGSIYECDGPFKFIDREDEEDEDDDYYDESLTLSSYGKFREKRLKDLIQKYNTLKVNETIHESITLCRIFQAIAEKQGLTFGEDFTCPPYVENTIVKLSDRKIKETSDKSCDKDKNYMKESLKCEAKTWEKEAPADIATAFRKAINDNGSQMKNIIAGVTPLLDWIAKECPDCESDVDTIRDDLQVIDPEASSTDLFADDVDDGTNEEYFNDCILNPIYDLCDELNIWIPTQAMMEKIDSKKLYSVYKVTTDREFVDDDLKENELSLKLETDSFEEALDKLEDLELEGYFGVIKDNEVDQFITEQEIDSWKLAKQYGVEEAINKTNKQEKRKQINEGAGAGYNINGELTEIKFTKINSIDVEEDTVMLGTAEFANISVEGTAYFKGIAEDYYNGGEVEGEVAIDSISINPNFIDYGYADDYNKITVEDLNNAFNNIKFKSDVIGGGWSHVPFDGKVKGNIEDNYEIDYINFHFINKEDISYVDKVIEDDSDDQYDDEVLDEGRADIYDEEEAEYFKALRKAQREGTVVFTVKENDKDEDGEEFDTFQEAKKYAKANNIDKIYVSEFAICYGYYCDGDYDEYEAQVLDLDKNIITENLKDSLPDDFSGTLKDFDDNDLWNKYQRRKSVEFRATELVKDYYNNEFDLPTLHKKLEDLFGSTKEAAKWFAENDDKIKNGKLNESTWGQIIKPMGNSASRKLEFITKQNPELFDELNEEVEDVTNGVIEHIFVDEYRLNKSEILGRNITEEEYKNAIKQMYKIIDKYYNNMLKESVEGDAKVQEYIDSKNDNFEKDKETTREVRKELAKQGIATDEQGKPIIERLDDNQDEVDEFVESFLDFLADHETAKQDFVDFFKLSLNDDGEVVGIEKVHVVDIIDWIMDHPQLAADFENFIGYLEEELVNGKEKSFDLVKYITEDPYATKYIAHSGKTCYRIFSSLKYYLLLCDKAGLVPKQEDDLIYSAKGNGFEFEWIEEDAILALDKTKTKEKDTLKEDTVKQGNAWVNKGKEGTHGKFKTKKEADAQRKAMFAQGFKESSNLSNFKYDRRAVEQEYGLEDGELDGVSLRDAEKIVGEGEGALDRFLLEDKICDLNSDNLMYEWMNGDWYTEKDFIKKQKKEVIGNKIAQLLADDIAYNGPFGGDPVTAKGNVLELESQGPLEIYRFNNDGSVDFVNIEDAVKGWIEEGEIDEDEGDFMLDEYAHFDSVLDLIGCGLSWFMDISDDTIEAIKKLLKDKE